MRIRWTAQAADDLEHIVNYIRQDNPEAALRMARTIFKGITGLREFPRSGRIGLAQDTRELVLGAYIVVYEIINDQVQILRIRHAAQNWPK